MIENLSAIRFVKPYDTPGKGGFPAAGGTGHSQDFPSVDIQRKILQDTGNRMPVQTEISETVYEEACACGFWYPSVAAGEPIEKGRLLGRLAASDGQILQEIRASFDGVALYYTTALGVWKGEPLVAYGRP